MRTYFLALILVLNISKSYSQSDDGALALAGLFALGSGIAAVEQMKEGFELAATEWLLENNQHPNFNIETLNIQGETLSDLSNVSVITFKVQEFDPITMAFEEKTVESGTRRKVGAPIGGTNKKSFSKQLVGVPNGEKKVLLMITSNGWINQYGVDFGKVDWLLLNKDEWIDIVSSYISLASGLDDKDFITESLIRGKLTRNGIKVDSENVVDFYRMTGDMYISKDYSEKIKLVYNENSMGLFLKDSYDLVQIRKGAIENLNDFILR